MAFGDSIFAQESSSLYNPQRTDSIEYMLSAEVKDTIEKHLQENLSYIAIFDYEGGNESSVLLMEWPINSSDKVYSSILDGANRYLVLKNRRLAIIPFEDLVFSNLVIKKHEDGSVSVGPNIKGGGILINLSGPPLSAKVKSLRLIY
jgi:siroheme synthase (precorrin-2 oxidase/ferrochelatase)